MSDVFFSKAGPGTSVGEVQRRSRALLERLVAASGVALEREIPLKVHFGEPGNQTYLKPATYRGVIDCLAERGIATAYIETSVLYGGKRYRKDLHLKTAADHGFSDLPVIIADGDAGGEFYRVKVGLKHFDECMLGAAFERYGQVIVLAHFKGHMLAGFGGALKQLSMGFAAKGGKLAMHMGTKPRIVRRKCTACGLCATRCAEGAIAIADGAAAIDRDKCVGCGACVAICPSKAATLISLRGALTMVGSGGRFGEKVVEYAYAAHKGRRNLYMNFAMSVTAGCDCEARKMRPVADDVGIFASTDPVALDKACWDALRAAGRKFRGEAAFRYAEKIGLGSAAYRLEEVE